MSLNNLETIFFAHATGFQASMYKHFLKGFDESFNIISLEHFGRNPKFPIIDNWENQALEAIDFLENKKTPVIGLGHSMGGILHLKAAAKRPELYKMIILLDAPVLMGRMGLVLWLSKIFGLVELMSPAKKSRKRKDRWKNREEAWEYLQKNSFFARFSPEALQDYFTYGIQDDPENPGQVTLNISIEEEIALFNASSHDLDFLSSKNLPPVIYFQANRRVVTSQNSIDRFVKRFEAKKILIEGGHMFPMERPDSSREILEVINKVIK